MIAAERIQYLQDRISRTEEQQAYKELFIELYPWLCQFAMTFIKSKELAEEIVSDVFIKIWEKRKELGKINNLKVYLYVATRNTAFNYLDQQKHVDSGDIEQFSAKLRSPYFDPEQLMITTEMVFLIQNAIDKLPPKCRMVFKLVKEDGLKYKEVAEILNISVKTVENHLAIALRKIGAVVSFDIHKTVSSPLGQ